MSKLLKWIKKKIQLQKAENQAAELDPFSSLHASSYSKLEADQLHNYITEELINIDTVAFNEHPYAETPLDELTPSVDRVNSSTTTRCESTVGAELADTNSASLRLGEVDDLTDDLNTTVTNSPSNKHSHFDRLNDDLNVDLNVASSTNQSDLGVGAHVRPISTNFDDPSAIKSARISDQSSGGESSPLAFEHHDGNQVSGVNHAALSSLTTINHTEVDHAAFVSTAEKTPVTSQQLKHAEGHASSANLKRPTSINDSLTSPDDTPTSTTVINAVSDFSLKASATQVSTTDPVNHPVNQAEFSNALNSAASLTESGAQLAELDHLADVNHMNQKSNNVIRIEPANDQITSLASNSTIIQQRTSATEVNLSNAPTNPLTPNQVLASTELVNHPTHPLHHVALGVDKIDHIELVHDDMADQAARFYQKPLAPQVKLAKKA